MKSLRQRYAYKRAPMRFLAACFDFFGFLFFFPFRFSPKKDFSKTSKILVVRLDALGDAVMTRPALAALHARFPEAQIDFLVSADIAPLFDDAREIRDIIPLANHWFSRRMGLSKTWRKILDTAKCLKEKKYDLAIDFRGDLRNILVLFLSGIPQRLGYGITGGGFLLTHRKDYPWQAHQVLTNLELLDCLGKHAAAETESFSYAGGKKKKFWDTTGKLMSDETRDRIVIHPGAGYPSKRWRGENYRELIARLMESGAGEIVLIGTENEKKLLPDFPAAPGKLADLRGKTLIEDLPILFDACRLYVGNDSGPAHIAAAQGLETIIIFSGTNDAKIWHPWTPHLRLIRHSVPCSPCESRECPLRHHDCMNQISVDQVFEEVMKALEEIRVS